MDPVRYRILGTTRALRPDGTSVPVGGARLRALLTVLALRPGRTVSAAVLVDEVWDGDPPADAPGALQALVGRLRRALGADAVESVDGGYRLAASSDDVDLHRFERLAGEGIRALADGDPAKAAAVLEDALALWHGPALADLPDRTAESARWETRRLDVRRARLGAALALGHAEQALPELTALCDLHPLDEPLHVLRLRALRDAGRPAEALAAYESVRALLADRLGSDPGPELRSLHAELLAGPRDRSGPRDGSGARGRTGARSGAGTPAASAAPASVEGALAAAAHTAVSAEGTGTGTGAGVGAGVGTGASGTAGAGAGHLAPDAGHPAPDAPGPTAGEAAHAPGPAFTSRISPASPPPGNLRARLTSFVGRESDIDAIRGDLAGARLVTLLGPGGAGKTRLSQEVAEALAPTLRDGVWLAELAPVDDPKAVPEAVLTAVGARETVLRGAGAEEMRAVAERHDDPLTRLAEHCAKRRMLIVLDNCEHVVDAAARLAEALLERCPGLTVLATSREPLGVPGELLRPVDPLPEPVALRLLADRGAAARPGFRVEDDPGAAAEICRRLDGLPLAIELAAARLRMLTPRQIADRLDDRFRLLTSGSRTVLPRQQTLRAVVDWSWDLLDEAERDVLRRLSVFAGGCDLAAAEAVCGPAALDVLGSLVDKSLVVAAPSGEGETQMRYRLLETVAEYAGERLDESGARHATERAHLTYYRELARTADPVLRGPGQRAAIDLIEREYENLRTALRHAVADRDEQEALCMVLSLSWYWQIRDQRVDARAWAREAMALGPDPFLPPVRPAAPLYVRCTDAPPPMRAEVLEEARRGVHLVHLAYMDMDMEAWQTPDAQEKLRTIGATYEPGMPQTCRNPGNLWFYAVLLTSTMDRFTEVINKTVSTCRELGYDWELAAALQMRANVLANRADLAGEATVDADEALELFDRIGDAWGAAESLSARGEAHERKGDYAAAAADYAAAEKHAERLGARAQTAVLNVRLGSMYIELGDAERGERMMRDVLADGHGAHNEAMPAARLYLATWLGRSGRVPEAREQIRLLRQDFTAGSFVVFDGFMLGVEAWLDAIDGHSERALDKARLAMARSTDALSRMIAPHMPSAHLTTAAIALSDLDGGSRARDAARLLGAADRLLPPGHFAGPMEDEVRRRAEAGVRAMLDDAAYEAAYAEGGGLSVEEATALI
ncbi:MULTISPECIES: BTAD domain-containing putative transcriptional regulator [unclassified Streptomyces]|uniref:AfsR/SARP family transcriptional regulator n=1 Tax=unclassified Streptomyces TaxID=2593676 RepID=UPI00225C12B3|nr:MULTISPECIES: BTAD domain-containing putative transcriptional regulator [unclassified Streptomyces]MCX4991338.1 winged helix-turn-helix domain-containing protein [Streptomyces sp. NBC_00568]MCX5003425.1 winged helix-turn-helix domain-containing protein [Streptomyces sp. NBC_00638]